MDGQYADPVEIGRSGSTRWSMNLEVLVRVRYGHFPGKSTYVKVNGWVLFCTRLYTDNKLVFHD